MQPMKSQAMPVGLGNHMLIKFYEINSQLDV